MQTDKYFIGYVEGKTAFESSTRACTATASRRVAVCHKSNS